MKMVKTGIWVSAGIISLFAFSNHAAADTRRFYHVRNNPAAHQEIRSDRREIWKDRSEYHKDLGELSRDRADLRRDVRRGASPADIAAKKAQIRQDLSEVAGDRRDVRGDFGQLRRDRNQYGWNRYPSNRYNNNDVGELSRDRADLRRDVRGGASPADISAKKAEIHQDLSELAADRRNQYSSNRYPSNRYNNSNDPNGWWNSWFGR